MIRTILVALALSLSVLPAHDEPRWQPNFKYTWQADQTWFRQCADSDTYRGPWNFSLGCRALLEILRGQRTGDLGAGPPNRLITPSPVQPTKPTPSASVLPNMPFESELGEDAL
jgi:hypothetical protein